jgi:hypothetical protein
MVRDVEEFFTYLLALYTCSENHLFHSFGHLLIEVLINLVFSFLALYIFLFKSLVR